MENEIKSYLPSKGVGVELVEFNSDGRIVQGALFTPNPKLFAESTTAVVLVHGVESYWYQGPTMFLCCYLVDAGYSVLGYNGVHSGRTFRCSEFETAVREAGDAVAFMNVRGFDKIYLAGHSLGTSIVQYYQGDKPDPSVRALGVYSPHINVPGMTRDSLLGAELYEKFVADCRILVAAGKGEEIKLLPFREGKVIITSAKTFLSYRDVKTSKANVEKMIRNIKVPFLVVYDGDDNSQVKGQVTTRASIVTQIKENAVNSPETEIMVIPSILGNSPLQAHRFVNNERLVIRKTVEWLVSIGLPPAPRRD